MAAQTSPDHDPLMHAFDTGFEQARREGETSKSERRLALAEATEKRKAGAGRRKGAQQRAKIKRETAGRQAAADIRTRERQQAGQIKLQQFMQMGEAKAKQKATARAAPSKGNFLTRRVSWGGSQLRPPAEGNLTRRVGGVNVGVPSSSGSVTATKATFQKATSARLILLSMGVAGVAIIVNSKGYPAYTAQGPNGAVKVPGTLHAFAGLTIAGTIALVVNEVSPDLGIVFAVGMVFIALADVKVFLTLGEAIFGKGKPIAAKPPSTGGASNIPNVSPNTPSPQGGQWLPSGNPGVQPGGQGPIEVPYGSPSG